MKEGMSSGEWLEIYCTKRFKEISATLEKARKAYDAGAPFLDDDTYKHLKEHLKLYAPDGPLLSNILREEGPCS